MATTFGRWLPPPRIWTRARGEVLFVPLEAVEVPKGVNWQPSPAALAALSGGWRPGEQHDSARVTGRVRLTLPRAGRVALLGRARGPLDAVTLGGAPLAGQWLGLDAGQDAGWRAGRFPRGWHPFTARADLPRVVVLDLHGAQLSQLALHFTEAR